MCALIERWMDTTHSFHMPFGEMTITLFDFSAITGLSFSREPILLSNEVYGSALVRNVWLKELFRATTSVKSGCSYYWFHDLKCSEKIKILITNPN